MLLDWWYYLSLNASLCQYEPLNSIASLLSGMYISSCWLLFSMLNLFTCMFSMPNILIRLSMYFFILSMYFSDEYTVCPSCWLLCLCPQLCYAPFISFYLCLWHVLPQIHWHSQYPLPAYLIALRSPNVCPLISMICSLFLLCPHPVDFP